MQRALLAIGIVLTAAALVFLAWFAWLMGNPGPPPYRYELVAEGGADRFPDLGLEDQDRLSIRTYEVRTQSVDEPLAVFHVGSKNNGTSVLLAWENRTAEPVLTLGAEISELTALAKAVSEHVGPDAIVLAWWDTSRQLELLAGTNVLFDEHLARPALIPPPWQAERDVIEAFERSFWKVPVGSRTEARFERYVDALLSDVPSGVRKLRGLAGDRETFVVVHLADAYKLGAQRPEEFGIGYKDFPRIGQLHGMISGVKNWLSKQGYESYTVEPRGESALRLYFLTDASARNTLIAQLLPFSTSNPVELEELAVVYQQGGYWVYKLRPGQENKQSAQPESPKT